MQIFTEEGPSLGFTASFDSQAIVMQRVLSFVAYIMRKWASPCIIFEQINTCSDFCSDVWKRGAPLHCNACSNHMGCRCAYT